MKYQTITLYSDSLPHENQKLKNLVDQLTSSGFLPVIKPLAAMRSSCKLSGEKIIESLANIKHDLKEMEASREICQIQGLMNFWKFYREQLRTIQLNLELRLEGELPTTDQLMKDLKQ